MLHIHKKIYRLTKVNGIKEIPRDLGKCTPLVSLREKEGSLLWILIGHRVALHDFYRVNPSDEDQLTKELRCLSMERSFI